jgi:Fur family transcriptional regulator, iron response regulator
MDIDDLCSAEYSRLRQQMTTNIVMILENAGLRVTHQRIAVARLLYDQEIVCCFTAEQLHQRAQDAGIRLAKATVYNIVRLFSDAGLLRPMILKGSVGYIVRLPEPGHLMIDRSSGDITTIASHAIGFSHLPDVPKDVVIDHIDVVIWTRKLSA